MLNENLKVDKVNLNPVEDKHITEINRMLEDNEAINKILYLGFQQVRLNRIWLSAVALCFSVS